MTDFSGSSAGIFLQAWNDHLQATQKVLERLANPTHSTTTPSLPFMDAWLKFAEGLGMKTGTDPIGGNIEEWFATLAPKLGYTREYQEIARRMLEQGLEFQRRHREFADMGSKITESALKAVRERAAQDPGSTASPDLAYEAWIESAEAAYAQSAHGEQFARSLGELCNLVSAFKVQRGKLLEALARHLDLPSRAEVDSLHREIVELRSELKARSPANTTARKPRKPKPRRTKSS
jgi:class III poly(R)-hydroxyalkanoic acid synthase PhaE subunit